MAAMYVLLVTLFDNLKSQYRKLGFQTSRDLFESRLPLTNKVTRQKHDDVQRCRTKYVTKICGKPDLGTVNKMLARVPRFREWHC